MRVLTGGLLRKMYGNEGDVYKLVKDKVTWLIDTTCYLVNIPVKEGSSALTFSSHGIWVIRDTDQKEADL